MLDPIAEETPQPDLPADMLTLPAEPTDSAPVPVPSGLPPPDLPNVLLMPRSEEAPGSFAEPAYGALGPEFSGELLEPAVDFLEPQAPDPAIDTAQVSIPLAAPEPALLEDDAPDPSMPLTPDVVPSIDELTFEEKWDSLARRLQADIIDTESPGAAVPPDLPDDMLRAETDAPETDEPETQ